MVLITIDHFITYKEIVLKDLRKTHEFESSRFSILFSV